MKLHNVELLRGKTIKRLRLEETRLEIVLEDGTGIIAEVHLVSDAYECYGASLSVILEPPPGEESGWIEL